MSALALATRGMIKPCCGIGPTDVKYTGFIRKEDDIFKPIIKLERFYVEDDDVPTRESLRGTIEVTEVKFIEDITGENNENKEKN